MICFYNLTNGLEMVDIKKEPHFVRIQSSHIETQAWNQLFNQLSDELLFYLAIGEECCIVEGSHNPRHSMLARVGIPVILYVLYRIWFNEIRSFPLLERRYLEKIYRSLHRSTKTKLKYYRKFLLTNEINLTCYIFITKKDGKYEWFREKIKNQKDG